MIEFDVDCKRKTISVRSNSADLAPEGLKVRPPRTDEEDYRPNHKKYRMKVGRTNY